MTYLVLIADFNGGGDAERDAARRVLLHAGVVDALRELRRVVVDVVHRDGHLSGGVRLSARLFPGFNYLLCLRQSVLGGWFDHFMV